MPNIGYRDIHISPLSQATVPPSDLSLIEVGEPLSTLESFRQSKGLVANCGLNPLVTSAATLFSLINKLGQTRQCSNLEKLRSDLIYEIKAFESAACAQGYHPDVILLARFALCATLDETLKHTAWGGNSLWEEKTLLAVFQGTNANNELFFTVLEKLQSRKNLPVDLIEFLYVSLSLGFLGKIRSSYSEQQRLEELLDDYYQLIRQQRPDITGILSDTAKITATVKTKVEPISIWLICFITTLLLVCIYCGFNYMLGVTTTPLYSKLDNLTSSLNYETNA